MLINRSQVEAALPGYQVEGDLGKGGYGLVLAGQHKLIGRKVAIKVLLDTSDDPDLRERFLSEARVLAELDHPHVVRIHDYVEYQGTCLLVMELLPGGTLKQRMAREPISPETTCALGLAAAAALSTAHSHGVLHRDVKPDNMMFAGDGLLKVTDFGIAKIFDGAETTASAILGTPRYMAPEQIMGSRLYPATDLYALAGVLYEIFAKRPLFGRPMAVQPLTHHHLTVMPEPLTSVSPAVANVIMRSLAKDPSQRHGDAADFALDLARASAMSFGANWLNRSEIKVRLDDEIREAALGTSTTPNPPPAHGRPVHRPPAGGPLPSGPMPSGPMPSGPMSGPQHGQFPPVAQGAPGVGYPGQTRPGTGPYPPYGAPGPASTPQPTPLPQTGPAGAGWPGYGSRPPVGNPPSGGHTPYGTATPQAPQAPQRPAPTPGWGQGGHPQQPPGGNQWGPRPPQPGLPQQQGPRPAHGAPGAPARGGQHSNQQRTGPFGLSPRVWWVVAGLAFVLVVSLTIGIVLAASGGSEDPGGPSVLTGTPGTGYAGAATSVDLTTPYCLTMDSAGTLYVCDSSRDKIYTLAADGTTSVFVGTGVTGFSGDNGPATAARVNGPANVVFGSDGTAYIADSKNYRIRKITPDGVISTFAGTGEAGFSGDGGPATAAQIDSVEGIAVADDGTVYLADYNNQRIRRIDPAGIITTVAGTGVEGYAADPGPATAAELGGPNDIAIGPDGSIYFGNITSDTVQRIAPDGTLTTIAGNGEYGFSGDGGPATAAQLSNPGVDVAADGTIYIPEYFNHRIRMIDASGIITTVAGDGTGGDTGSADDDGTGAVEGDAGDGGPATDAQIVNPAGVVVDETGAVYIADSGYPRVRRIGPDGVITTVLQPTG